MQRGLNGGRRVFGLSEARQLHLHVERQLAAQRLQRFGRHRALLQHLQLLKIKLIGLDDRLRLADHIREQELDGRQMPALGVEQQDIQDVLNVALGHGIDQGGAQGGRLPREGITGTTRIVLGEATFGPAR